MKALPLLILLPPLALAHSGEAEWFGEPWALVPLLLSAGLYAAGLLRLRGRGVRWTQMTAFVLGWLALAGAMLSLLHGAGRVSFTAHMAEHELLMIVAAPLLVLSRLVGVFRWAFPRTMRPDLIGAFRNAPASGLWRALSGAVMATILHGVALWAWQLPAAFDAALADEGLHTAQHASFLVGPLFFW